MRVFFQGFHPFPRRPAGTAPLEDQAAVDAPCRRHIGAGPPRQFAPDRISLSQRQRRAESHIVPGIRLGPDIARNRCCISLVQGPCRRAVQSPLDAEATVEQAGMAVDRIGFPVHDAQAAAYIGLIPGSVSHGIAADRIRKDIAQGQAGLGFPEELLGQEPCFVIMDGRVL